MKLRAVPRDLSQLEVDVAVCFAYQGDAEPRGLPHRAIRRELAEEMRREGFRGRPTDVVVWNANGRVPTRRFLVQGLGPRGGSSGLQLLEGAARAVRGAGRLGARRIALFDPSTLRRGAAESIRAAAEGAWLGAYRFDRYLTDETRRTAPVESIAVATDAAPGTVRNALTAAARTAEAVCLARDLVNEPPSILGPEAFAARAKSLARKVKLRCRVMGRPELERLGMGALLAVARGSSQEPQVVHLHYRPTGKTPRKRVVLVGKGVTFDSGGLNLKPGNSMLTMKGDMAGAAAVLATLTAAARMAPGLEIHGFLGLVENMTGASAYKPGDILKTYSGKTVEVGNTDAEGRLVLADLLAYAVEKLKPDVVLDLATLTGACVVALGPLCAGLFSRDRKLARQILEAGERGGERLWELPLFEEYLEMLQAGPADLKNVGGRWGGAITAALFLGEFVPKDVPWAHLDIAGPAFYEKDRPEAPEGGSGAGVRTLLRWLEAL